MGEARQLGVQIGELAEGRLEALHVGISAQIAPLERAIDRQDRDHPELDEVSHGAGHGHLPEDQEMEVIRRTTILDTLSFTPTLGAADIVEFQKLVRRVPVADDVIRYAVRLVRMTRPDDAAALDFVKTWVEYGASVRAAQYLVLGGKARALMLGHSHVGFDDIRALAKPVLRHRLLRTFAAESGRVTTDTIVDRVLERVTPPPSNLR